MAKNSRQRLIISACIAVISAVSFCGAQSTVTRRRCCAGSGVDFPFDRLGDFIKRASSQLLDLGAAVKQATDTLERQSAARNITHSAEATLLVNASEPVSSYQNCSILTRRLLDIENRSHSQISAVISTLKELVMTQQSFSNFSSEASLSLTAIGRNTEQIIGHGPYSVVPGERPFTGQASLRENGDVMDALFSDVERRLADKALRPVHHVTRNSYVASLPNYTMPEKLTHTDILLEHIIERLQSLPTVPANREQAPSLTNLSASPALEAYGKAYLSFASSGQPLASEVSKAIRDMQAFSAFTSPAARTFPPQRTFTGCRDAFAKGQRTGGVFSISIPQVRPFRVWCDFDGGTGWAVIQRRFDGSTDFFKTWSEYENGFGSLWGEYWLGLSGIWALSEAGVRLSVYMEDFDSQSVWANYSSFRIGNASTYYQLEVTGYSGSGGDSFRRHSGSMFSTWDVDKDQDNTASCARTFFAGWWYYSCLATNLNGRYERGPTASTGTSMCWGDFKGVNYSLRSSIMRINA